MKPCSKGILNKGDIVLICNASGVDYYTENDNESERIEAFVKDAINITDLDSNYLGVKRKSKTDWHYMGGRAVIKTLDKNPNLITDSLNRLLDKYKITKYQ